MILIVGLGNPGEEFKFTRHNIGFEVIDSIHNQFEFPAFKKKFDGVYSKKFIFDENVIIFKPQTFMNLSGSPIKKIRGFFNIDDSSDLIVIHDDLDMDFLNLRIKSKGGHGGHNGIRDIIKFHGEDFYRIKLGIKNELYKKKNIKSEYFVLDKFDLNERKIIECFKRKCNKNFEFMVKKKFSLLNFN